MAIVPFQAFPDSSHGGILLRDTCNACRAPCILFNLPLSLAVVGLHSSITSESEIIKQLHLLFATILPQITSQ